MKPHQSRLSFLRRLLRQGTHPHGAQGIHGVGDTSDEGGEPNGSKIVKNGIKPLKNWIPIGLYTVVILVGNELDFVEFAWGFTGI